MLKAALNDKVTPDQLSYELGPFSEQIMCTGKLTVEAIDYVTERQGTPVAPRNLRVTDNPVSAPGSRDPVVKFRENSDDCVSA